MPTSNKEHDLIEESVVDVLHSRMGYDIDDAFAIGMALEYPNHEPKIGTLNDLSANQLFMIKEACVTIAKNLLDAYHEIDNKSSESHYVELRQEEN